MSKTLILEELWFPNYGGDDSKKNFRLIYFITCEVEKVDEKNNPIKDADGTVLTQEVTIIVEKPKTKDCWQWEKEKENLYLPPKSKTVDPIELDLSRLKTNNFGFQADNYRVQKFVGKLLSVRVQIYDVDDKNFGDYLKKLLVVVGADAIKLVAGSVFGLPVAVADLIAKGVMVFIGDGKQTEDKLGEKDTEQKNKDKLLFGGFSDYQANAASIQIEGEKFWSGTKKGTYRIKMGFE
jgi:hypothetical protein